MRNVFLRLGTSLLISHYTNEDIRNIMKREAVLKMVNYNFSENILKTLARLTPSFGLAGTVISLIRMFKHLQSVDAIAPLMAVALMSTFYGVILSNLIMLPLAAKLKDRAVISEALMQITIEGMVAINNMENPLRIEELIAGYQEPIDVGLSGVHVSLNMTKSAEGV
jgi:chemotaxis protein MotA